MGRAGVGGGRQQLGARRASGHTGQLPTHPSPSVKRRRSTLLPHRRTPHQPTDASTQRIRLPTQPPSHTVAHPPSPHPPHTDARPPSPHPTPTQGHATHPMASPTLASASISSLMVTPAYVGSSPRSSQMEETIWVGARTCKQCGRDGRYREGKSGGEGGARASAGPAAPVVTSRARVVLICRPGGRAAGGNRQEQCAGWSRGFGWGRGNDSACVHVAGAATAWRGMRRRVAWRCGARREAGEAGGASLTAACPAQAPSPCPPSSPG